MVNSYVFVLVWHCFLVLASSVLLCLVSWSIFREIQATNSQSDQSVGASSPTSPTSATSTPPASPRSVSRIRSRSLTFDTQKPYCCGLTRPKLLVRVTHALIFIACLLTVLQSVVYALTTSNLISCSAQFSVYPSVYILLKGLTYCVFVIRIEAIFSDTVYQYSSRLLRGMYVTIAVGTLCLVILAATFLEHTHSDHGSFQDCDSIKTGILGPCTVSFDMLVSVVCLRLFTKPLWNIYRMEKMNRSPDLDQCDFESRPRSMSSSEIQATQIKKIASKARLLTFTAILSSFISLVLAILVGFDELFPLDQLVNCLCLVFMTRWFGDYYAWVCAFPLFVERLVNRAWD